MFHQAKNMLVIIKSKGVIALEISENIVRFFQISKDDLAHAHPKTYTKQGPVLINKL